MNFIERHDLWNAEQRRTAAEATRRIETDGIELVRLSFPDLHGILRGKALAAAAIPSALADS
jgi:glutamine synthetase